MPHTNITARIGFGMLRYCTVLYYSTIPYCTIGGDYSMDVAWT